jgi:pterin-4a-carbinolamine dehydratase
MKAVNEVEGAVTVPGVEGLKAERVQLTVTGALPRLKAERVQVSLKTLPGWRLARGGRAIDRVREFPDAPSAAAFTSYVAQVAMRMAQPVALSQVGAQLAITLPGKPQRGPGGGITETVLELARALG